MERVSNKTLAALSGVSLLVLLLGVLSSSDYGISAITGFGIGEAAGSFADSATLATIVISIVINVILLIILLKKKNS